MDDIRKPGMRVILSTNFMETGVTISDLIIVIDSMKFKCVFYDPVRMCEVDRDMPVCKNMQE